MNTERFELIAWIADQIEASRTEHELSITMALIQYSDLTLRPEEKFYLTKLAKTRDDEFRGQSGR
jgi:hypothetical protein